MNKLVLIMLFCFFWAFAVHAEFKPFLKNKGTIYEYSQDDLPDICFFGKGARWDGYNVVVADWNKLTDYQKTAFISEGSKEIEQKENVKVAWNYGWDVLIAVNGAVKILNEEKLSTDVLMINLLKDIFSEAGLLN